MPAAHIPYQADYVFINGESVGRLRLGLTSGYATDVLPPLMVAGLGIGLVIAPR